MRGLLTEALTETCSVLSGTVTDDGGGGASSEPAATAGIPCRIDSLGGKEGEAGERISDRSTHLVTLPAGTSITTDNTLRIDGRGTYEVTAVRENTGEFARFAEVVSQ